MTTLEKIQTELRRQYEASRAFGIGWLDLDDPERSKIDGEVDLVALARAIDTPTDG